MNYRAPLCLVITKHIVKLLKTNIRNLKNNLCKVTQEETKNENFGELMIKFILLTFFTTTLAWAGNTTYERQNNSSCTEKICPGDIVYNGTRYLNGAKVVAVNPNYGTAVVRNPMYNTLHTENIKDLDITKGCVSGICIDDVVYNGIRYLNGARVVAVNPNYQTVVVRDPRYNTLHTENPIDLDVTKGCISGICIGDIFYNGSRYMNGARVVAVNLNSQIVVVRDPRYNTLHTENPSDLDIIDQCLDFDNQRY